MIDACDSMQIGDICIGKNWQVHFSARLIASFWFWLQWEIHPPVLVPLRWEICTDLSKVVTRKRTPFSLGLASLGPSEPMIYATKMKKHESEVRANEALDNRQVNKYCSSNLSLRPYLFMLSASHLIAWHRVSPQVAGYANLNGLFNTVAL